MPATEATSIDLFQKILGSAGFACEGPAASESKPPDLSNSLTCGGRGQWGRRGGLERSSFGENWSLSHRLDTYHQDGGDLAPHKWACPTGHQAV
jgi:hypothetical protein